ncbi:MAG: hypothetical protein ACREYF_26930 [Gammaproteobacteria bacterium]
MPPFPEKSAADALFPHISRLAPVLLRTLFLHHDGIVLGATIAALQTQGLLEALVREQRLSMRDLRRRFPCNPGYLHVALRCLALQGWIVRAGFAAADSMEFELAAKGYLASKAFPLYMEVGRFLYSGVALEDYLGRRDKQDDGRITEFGRLAEKAVHGWGLSETHDSETDPGLFQIIGTHLDGMLVGPLMIWAKMHGWLDGDRFPRDNSLPEDAWAPIAALLAYLGWMVRDGDSFSFTQLGKVACQFSMHYGLTLSYHPLFCRLPRLIFNGAINVTHVDPGQEETHVDRTLNVLASGVAHRPYFEDSNRIILDIFNRQPILDQPRFVADMGCGDGAWLQGIYEVVRTRTLRGRYLNDYPLLMIGTDYNAKAREVAAEHLQRAEIPSLILFGDVSDPDHFAEALKQQGIDICEGLHIRAFIDHNRRYLEPVDGERAERRMIRSSGAFADQQGNAILNNYLEQNLVEHFEKWLPYIKNHGLIIIEAHNIEPSVAAKYNGKAHATAFDTYHGYSNQYPVDFEAYIALTEEAGFRAISYQQRVYPSRLPFVAISVNHFKAKDSVLFLPDAPMVGREPRQWQPDGAEDTADGEALHRFLFEDGDLARPRRWCFHSTGALVAAVLDELEQRVEEIRPAGKRRITLADYGTGTGLATLELIKGLNAKGLLWRMQSLGIGFRLQLFDFPSGWFAKAYALLHGFPFVEFYSLKRSDRINLLSDLIPDQSLDILYASMVLHLVPPKVLPLLFRSFTQALVSGGRFIWNTPDTAPAAPHAELIHAPNRALRKAVLAAIDDPCYLRCILTGIPRAAAEAYQDLIPALAPFGQRVTAKKRAEAKAKADKQILSVATDVHDILSGLDDYFTGELSTLVSVFSESDSLSLGLLPSNQCVAGEIVDPQLRAKLIGFLLRYDVLPAFHNGPAGNPEGFNLHWTFGRYRNKR